MTTIVLAILLSTSSVASALHAWLGIRKSSALVRGYQARLLKHPFDSAGALHYSALSRVELKALNGGLQTGSKHYPSSAQVAKLTRPERMAYLARARVAQRLAPLAGPVAAVVIPVLLSQFGDEVYRWLEGHLSKQWAQSLAAIGLVYAVLAIPVVLALGIAVEVRAARRVEVLETSLRSKARGRPSP